MPPPSDLATLSDEDLLREADELSAQYETFRQENALLYYVPVSDTARQFHLTADADVLGLFGGNRSSKTASALADLAICATGIIPDSLKADYPRSKLRGPCQIRIVVESLVNTLEPVILPKLQWFHFDGDLSRGLGMYGLIPKHSLIDGDWEKSYSKQFRTLKVKYRDPDHLDDVQGHSTIQFMSFDVHPSDFESGSFHHILMDEPPPHSIFKANRARIMSTGGRLILSMTWPDNPAINVEWIFDEVYEKGLDGPQRVPRHYVFVLSARDNAHIDQASLERMAAQMSRLERLTRIEGQPIRFSNRIHPLFTDHDMTWCFACGEAGHVAAQGKACAVCGSADVATYNHVQQFEENPTWPTVYLLDPHPRKPHMMLWVQVDGNDDLWVVAEAEVQDDPKAVKQRCDEIERSLKLRVAQRLMDPNMGRSPSGIDRSICWQDEFEKVNLYCECADDSDVGRARLNDYLKPDKFTRRPRITIKEDCFWTRHQMHRYVWADKDRQQPKTEHDDRPTLLKYLLNSEPSFAVLNAGRTPIRIGQRTSGYA